MKACLLSFTTLYRLSATAVGTQDLYRSCHVTASLAPALYDLLDGTGDGGQTGQR